MAVNESTKGVTMRLVSNAGTDDTGKAITHSKSYANINRAATVEQIMTGAKAIHTLYSGTLEHVYTVTTKELTEES